MKRQTRHSPLATSRYGNYRAAVLVLALGALRSTAQDIHLSQFFNAPLVLNPANAGDIEGDQRAGLMYRTQWQSAGSPFRTQAFSYDLPLFRQRMKGRYLGLGVHLFSDKAGNTELGDTQGNLSVSYAIKSGQNALLAFGIQGGYGQRSAVLNGMRWDSQYNGAGYDPDLPTGETMADASTNFVDFGAGVLWKGETKNGALWKSGASVYHLNQPMVSLFGSNDDRLLRRYVVHAEMRFEGKKWTWLPKVYAQQQGGGREIVLGALMHRRINVDSRYTRTRTAARSSWVASTAGTMPWCPRCSLNGSESWSRRSATTST